MRVISPLCHHDIVHIKYNNLLQKAENKNSGKGNENLLKASCKN